MTAISMGDQLALKSARTRDARIPPFVDRHGLLLPVELSTSQHCSCFWNIILLQVHAHVHVVELLMCVVSQDGVVISMALIAANI